MYFKFWTISQVGELESKLHCWMKRDSDVSQLVVFTRVELEFIKFQKFKRLIPVLLITECHTLFCCRNASPPLFLPSLRVLTLPVYSLIYLRTVSTKEVLPNEWTNEQEKGWMDEAISGLECLWRKKMPMKFDKDLFSTYSEPGARGTQKWTRQVCGFLAITAATVTNVHGRQACVDTTSAQQWEQVSHVHTGLDLFPRDSCLSNKSRWEKERPFTKPEPGHAPNWAGLHALFCPGPLRTPLPALAGSHLLSFSHSWVRPCSPAPDNRTRTEAAAVL